MPDPSRFACPCGEPAPPELPPPGRTPVPCRRCGTPLVQPGRVPGRSLERGLGAALLVAVASAGGWALVVWATGSGAAWAVLAAGALVGIAARAAARARGLRVQVAAAMALALFFVLGEFLIYRHALLPRLIALHEEEGASDARLLAEEELERIHDDFGRYLDLESSLAIFLGVAAGTAAALCITRAPPSVVAFTSSSSPGEEA